MKKLVLIFLTVVLVVAVLIGWQFWSSSHSSKSTADEAPLHPTPGLPWFVEVRRAAGVDFVHFDPATEKHYIHETFGSGLGWIDYDNDGRLDLLCLQDGPVQAATSKQPLPTNKMYCNLGKGRFRDVTSEVGLHRAGFHMGCAVADYDNDGFDDLLITYLDGMVLYHNEKKNQSGQRYFVDVTEACGLHNNPHFATSCAFGDVDNDGFVDLYVCNYVDIDLAKHPLCQAKIQDKQIYIGCAPTALPYAWHKLYRNIGGKKFEDISKSSGIAKAKDLTMAPGLAVLMCDLDEDGNLDIYVANDLSQAYLFHNQGNATFKEVAVFSGCGLHNGVAMAGMGIDAGDLDGSGRLSLFVTNYQNQVNVLYQNRDRLDFENASYRSGLAVPSLPRLAFGTAFFDADADGWLDIAVANGHVQRHAALTDGVPFPQRDQLFHNIGRGKFKDISAKAGRYFHQAYVGRGLAVGDYNNDLKPDLAISNNSGPAILLKNATVNDNHTLVLELEGDGQKSNRNAIGARVVVETGKKRQLYVVNGGGSYLSAHGRRLHIGLGKNKMADRIIVTWPSKKRQVFSRLQAGKHWVLREGVSRAEEKRLGQIN